MSKGKWIYLGCLTYRCSECGVKNYIHDKSHITHHRFCFSCGKRMERVVYIDECKYCDSLAHPLYDMCIKSRNPCEHCEHPEVCENYESMRPEEKVVMIKN